MGPHMSSIVLNRLQHKQVVMIVEGVTKGKPLPGELVHELVEKTDGIPLFVEELTKMVLESGVVREGEKGYELVEPLPSITIPTTLHDSLMARLDGLSIVKEVAQLGAAIGREFPYELLQEVYSEEESILQESLSRLVEAELLFQTDEPPKASYAFKHALIQDAAYESILKRRRREYHTRIAEVIEERFGDIVENRPELLAHQYTEARIADKAIPYWQRAGQRGLDRSAFMEGINQINKGLELLNSLPDSREKLQQEIGSQMIKGNALLATKGFGAPEVEKTFTRAHQLCQQVREEPMLYQALSGLWIFNLARSRLSIAQDIAEQLLSIAEKMQGPSQLAGAHHSLGTTLFFTGEFLQAQQHFNKVHQLSHSIEKRLYSAGVLENPLVFTLIMDAMVQLPLGYPEQALKKSIDGISLANEFAHPYYIAQAKTLAANLNLLLRDMQATEKHAKEAIQLSNEEGFPLWLSIATMFYGQFEFEMEDKEKGVQQFQKGFELFKAVGSELNLTFIYGMLAEIYRGFGQVEKGLDQIDQGLTQVEKNGEHWYEAELYRLKGELLLNLPNDNMADAEECFQKSLEIARLQHAKFWELRTAMSLSRLWQRQGKKQEGRQILSNIYSWFTEGFDTKDLQDAKALLQELS